ncbi:hypothetical protein Tco_0248420 [Tanacetum coccineum]
MEKFETPPDSLPITVIDPDDQPMWSGTRTVAPTPSSAIIQLPISDNFHIKGTHMQMIRDNQIDGRIRFDPYRHVACFLEISNLFQYGKNQEEAVMLRTFPFLLSGEAKTCLNELNEGTITSFHQLDNKNLVEACLRMKEMLRTCYGHGLTKGTIIQIFYHGLDDPTQGILDVGGIFLYNTPNEAFKILENKVLLKLDFSDDFQNSPKPKAVVSASGSNLNSDLAILVDKFKDLATKIYSEFLIIRKEIKEMRDGRRNNNASQIYLKDDMPMCDPMEANYVQRYHGGYHDRNSRYSHSYLNHNPNCHYPQPQPRNRMPHPSHQGLRNRQTIIENLERQFKYLEKIQPTKSLPHTTNTKPRHEFVYKPPSIQNENDKGNVKAIEEEEIKPIPTMPNPNPIMSNSPTVSPFLKDCTVHIPYTNAKTFADDVLLNHVGDEELSPIDGVVDRVLTKKEIKKDDKGMPKEPIKDWKLNEKVVPRNDNVYHYLWNPTKIPHLNRIIKES